MMSNLSSRGTAVPPSAAAQTLAKPEAAKPAVVATTTAVTQAPSAIQSALQPPPPDYPTGGMVTKPAVVTVAHPTAVQQASAAIKSAITAQPAAQPASPGTSVKGCSHGKIATAFYFSQLLGLYGIQFYCHNRTM